MSAIYSGFEIAFYKYSNTISLEEGWRKGEGFLTFPPSTFSKTPEQGKTDSAGFLQGKHESTPSYIMVSSCFCAMLIRKSLSFPNVVSHSTRYMEKRACEETTSHNTNFPLRYNDSIGAATDQGC